VSANLKLKKLRSATYFSLEESFRNVVGTPVISCVQSGNGLQRAGIYTLTFTAVTPGGTGTVHIATPDPHNPSRDPGGKVVNLDGATVYDNIIEGLRLVFSDGGAFNDSWTATVYYGAFYDSADATEQSVLNEGVVEAGTTVGTDRVVVENVGGDLSASSTVRVVNGVRYVNSGSSIPFTKIDYTEVSQTANFDPGYGISFANSATGVIDIRVDGLTYDVKRIDTGVIFPGGAGVPRDSLTVLEWTAGPLTGLRFVLNTSTANGSTATIYVADGARFIELAPDVSGSAGTWQAGTTPLTLTEDGGAIIGEIGAGTRAFFHQRVKSLSTDSPVGNQRHWRYILRGLGV
jgi:hypothetical protein